MNLRILTRRERECFVIMCEDGLLNKEIAWRVGLTEWCVKTHLSSAYKKLGIVGGTRPAMAMYWHARVNGTLQIARPFESGVNLRRKGAVTGQATAQLPI